MSEREAIISWLRYRARQARSTYTADLSDRNRYTQNRYIRGRAEAYQQAADDLASPLPIGSTAGLPEDRVRFVAHPDGGAAYCPDCGNAEVEVMHRTQPKGKHCRLLRCRKCTAGAGQPDGGPPWFVGDAYGVPPWLVNDDLICFDCGWLAVKDDDLGIYSHGEQGFQMRCDECAPRVPGVKP